MRILDARPGVGGVFGRRRLLRGVAFIYFALLAIPTFFFGAGMATDFTTVITANREVANAVQSAALAGAEQFIPNTSGIDPIKGPAAAVQTYCVAKSNDGLGMVSAVNGPGMTPYSCRGGQTVYLRVQLTQAQSSAGTVYATLSVTAYYQIPNLTFSRLFGGGSSTHPLSVTRTAQVCVPNTQSGVFSGGTNGYCASPHSVLS